MDQPELRQLQQEFDYLLVTTLEGAYAKGCKGLSMWCALRKAFGREINFLLAHDTLYALADDVVHNRAAPPELSTFLLTWLSLYPKRDPQVGDRIWEVLRAHKGADEALDKLRAIADPLLNPPYFCPEGM